MSRDYYKVLLVSQSGKGKTYSFRNMNKETTGFINVELKPLPFKGNFKYHGKPTAQGGVFAALKAYNDNKEIDCIVIDSLSAVLDLFLAEAKATKKGRRIAIILESIPNHKSLIKYNKQTIKIPNKIFNNL